ncbi:MAG: choice-of-anchor B family protein [Gemmatimonadetes bacterium]|nr:choice-of-anchor B family protein [Gemmatimonadota bacterium]
MKKTIAAAFAALAFAGTGTAYAQANYGGGVALVDGTAFVSQATNAVGPGRVYAYHRAGGDWAELAQITAPDAAQGDGFGYSLAAAGSRLIVGQPAHNGGRGSVHVYERRGQQWEHVTALVPAAAAANDSIGVAVAMHGDAVIIGGANSAWIFRRGGSGWALEAALTGSDAADGDGFGRAVAINAERAIVGAPLQAEGRGAAYLFDRGTAGWAQTSKLLARTVTAGSGLGARVALMRDYGVAAAPGRDENTGAVYLFERNPQAAGWAAFTRLFPFDASSNSQFGASLAVVGDDLWVGSPGADGFTGTMYRFHWDAEASDWTANRKLSLPETLGFSMAFAVLGNHAIAGMPFADQGEGAALILQRDANDEWSQAAKVVGITNYYASVTGGALDCVNGQASVFNCSSNVELQAFLPINEIGGGRGVNLNDIWGWTDPQTGREYALVGRSNGTSFVDVTDAANPRYLGDLPMTDGARANAWRDIKVYADHAFIVADGSGPHGMQVFDLTKLRNVQNAPATFTEDAIYDRIASAHNIVINEETGTAFAVGVNSGGEVCGGGLHMIDIRQPKAPSFLGCFSDPRTGNAGTGYSHDAQCVTYNGPHQKYAGREICFGSNETALSIADVTDRENPVALSRASYPDVQYSHQGWLTPDQRWFYMNDEGDEVGGVAPRTRTIIWDVSDLDDPQVAGMFMGETAASDHNLYIVGDTMYQSNYSSGLRIIDISDRSNPREIGFFDSYPTGDDEAGFTGSWSNYPYFRSGNIIFTSIGEGLFIVRTRRPIS